MANGKLNTGEFRQDILIHRERLAGRPDSPVVAFFRGEPGWKVWWRFELADGTGDYGEREGPFDSLELARRHAAAA